MPRAAWGAAVVLVVVGVLPGLAQSGPVAPTGGPPAARPALAFDPTPPAGEPPPEPEVTPVTRREGGSTQLPNVLGPPVRGAPVRSPDRDSLPSENTRENIRVAGAERGEASVPQEPEAPPRSRPGRPGEASPGVRRAAALGAPEGTGNPVPAHVVEPAARRTPANPADDPVNDFLEKRSGLRDQKPAARSLDRGFPGDSTTSNQFGEQIGDTLNNAVGQRGESWFKSDHCFDGFISPVTNPFLFEDPRSLTEVRPLFMFQKIPGSQPDFQGGNVWFFGAQARVAFTNRLSLVVNKLGGISINPSGNSPFNDQTGFAELWLGPKYTILRGEDTGSLLGAGLQFQIPVGSQGAFQNTGSLSIVPYVTYGQNFFRDFKYGSFNALVGTGYAFSVNNQRSEYYYLSAHLDLDWKNNHKFYPLTEMNWYIYTKNGNSLPIGAEGRDLFNFGGQAKGQGLLTWAFGARYKITESAQFGGAFEFPLAGPRDLFQYRFTIDFILRY